MALGSVATALSDTLVKQNCQSQAAEESKIGTWILTDPYVHSVLTKFTSHDSPLQTYRHNISERSRCRICGGGELKS